MTKRKRLAWNASNPLYRWQMKHRKTNKAGVNSKPSDKKVKTVARRRRYFPRRFRRKAKMTIPIAPVMGLIATATNNGVIQNAQAGNWNLVMDALKWNFTGIAPDGSFNGAALIQNITPLAIGMGIHIAASKLGVNRVMAQAKIPYIRI